MVTFIEWCARRVCHQKPNSHLLHVPEKNEMMSRNSHLDVPEMPYQLIQQSRDSCVYDEISVVEPDISEVNNCNNRTIYHDTYS